MKALIVCKHQENSKEFRACKLIKKTDLEAAYSWKNTLKKTSLRT